MDLEFLIENICGFGAVYNRCRLGSPFFLGGKRHGKVSNFYVPRNFSVPPNMKFRHSSSKTARVVPSFFYMHPAMHGKRKRQLRKKSSSKFLEFLASPIP